MPIFSSLCVKPGKERDILEFFPLALYSIAMVVKSGGSVESGLQFVAERDFGRVSLLCKRVPEIARESSLEAGLRAIREESTNRFYREAIDLLISYAKHGISVGDKLVSIGHRMQQDALMTKRDHLRRVRESLIPLTSMLLIGVPIVLGIAVVLLTQPSPMQAEPPATKEQISYLVIAWLVILAITYPLLFRSFILKNRALTTPTLRELQRMFMTDMDGPISRFLDNMASFIEMGMSLESAFYQALPHGSGPGSPEYRRLMERGLESLNDPGLTFTQSLYRFAGALNNRKFDLTVEFIERARNSKTASVAGTLHLLSESFWSSHITTMHYQTPAMTPAFLTLAFKWPAMLFTGTAFPQFMPLILLFLFLDTIIVMVALM